MATTTDFVAHVMRLASGPQAVAQGTLSADIYAHGDLEIQSRLLPLLRDVQQEYGVRSIDVVGVNGRVDLPARASGAGVRLAQLLIGSLAYSLPRMELEDASFAQSGGTPYGFAFDGGGLVLLPLGSSGTVRLRYYARPGRMVDVSACGLIAAVTPDSPTLGRTTLSFSTAFVPTGNLADIVAQGPAHEHLAISIPCANVTISALDVPSASLLGTVKPGDYLAQQDTSPFVPLPEELLSVLVHRTAARLLMAQGYLAESRAQMDAADSAQAVAASLLQPRASGNPQRLTGGTVSALGGARSAWRY